MTLPLLIAYRNASQNDQEIIKKAINQGDVSQLTKIFEIIKKNECNSACPSTNPISNSSN